MTVPAVSKANFIFPRNLFGEIFRITRLSWEINGRVRRLRYFFARYVIRFWNWFRRRLRDAAETEAGRVGGGGKKRVEGRAKSERENKRERERKSEEGREVGTSPVRLLVFTSSARKIRQRRHLHHSAIFWILAVIPPARCISPIYIFNRGDNRWQYYEGGVYDASSVLRCSPARFFASSSSPPSFLFVSFFFRNLYRDA